MASKRRKKRPFKLKNPRPIRFVPAPDPDSVMGRVSAEDGARMRSQPDLQAFVRPLVPGEFGDIRVASEEALKRMTHVYVQRVEPGTIARLRIPITAERAAAYVEGELLDVIALQAELVAEEDAELTDDPFTLPEDSQRLTIVAAARGAYATLSDYPQLEQEKEALQKRARQIIEHHVQLWPGITNDIDMYTRLFVPAFVFGYRLGEGMLQEMTAGERRQMLQRIASMDPPEVLFLLDQSIRGRMREMGVEDIYGLL